MGRIWMKLYVGWHESDWLSVLSAESRLCWILLLERVKTHGDGGSLKKTNYDDLAKRWNVGAENVRNMVKAAAIDGAVEEDETHWHVTGWSEYQEDRTNADRQKRYRDRQKRNETGSGNGALRNDRNVTGRGEERRVEEKPPKSPLGDFGGSVCPALLVDTALIWQGYRKERKQPLTKTTWDSLFKKYKANPDLFRESVEFTILKGWQGLKEPDVSGSLTKGSAPKFRSASEVHLATD